MKRTNIVLDEKLLARAQAESGIKTARGIVDHALRELVRHARQRRLLRLRGRVAWGGDLAALRRGRSFPPGSRE
ncbi:MAG: type II toxin-antitoxin system VapB family antitoxin [Planctomycetes bacterium]|nr:type II toxin-antitoxin system VapB family antitoxin [Planctomycetota bacterium]